jgi:hypothetical protein
MVADKVCAALASFVHHVVLKIGCIMRRLYFTENGYRIIAGKLGIDESIIRAKTEAGYSWCSICESWVLCDLFANAYCKKCMRKVRSLQQMVGERAEAVMILRILHQNGY